MSPMPLNVLRLLTAFVLATSLCSAARAADDAKHFATRSGLHFYAGGDIDVTAPAETVFAAGGDVTVQSKDIGEVFAAGGDVTLTDIVTNRIIAAGGNVDIGGTITKSIIAAGGDVKIHSGTTIGGDAVLAGGDVNIDGDVGGDLVVTGGTVTIAGHVAGDANVRGGKIVFMPGASVAGNLTYRSRDAFAVPEGVTIGGTVSEGVKKERERWTPGAGFIAGAFAIALIVMLVGIVVLVFCAVVVMAVFRRQIDHAAALVTEQPLQSLGLGMLLAIAFPMTIVVLLITIIGIPFSLLLMVVGTVLTVLGVIVAAYWIGMKFRDALSDNQGVPDYFPALGWTLAGLALFCVVGLLPLVGTMAQFFALTTGLGALVLSFMERSTPRGPAGGAYGAPSV